MMDWRLGILIINIVVILFNIGMYLTIKLNDLKHLSKDLEEIKKVNKGIFRRLGHIERNQSAMQAVCDLRHKND